MQAMMLPRRNGAVLEPLGYRALGFRSEELHMKKLSIFSAAAVASLLASQAPAAVVYTYWNFDVSLPSPINPGVSGTFPYSAPLPTTANNMPVAASLQLATANNALATANSQIGGSLATNYVAANGTSYPAGVHMLWNPNSGNAARLTMNLTGLENPVLRFDYRFTSGMSPTAFGQITYNLGSGPVSIGTNPPVTADSTFRVYTLNLAALNAIDNQASVVIDIPIPTVPTNGSFRMDNFEVTASTIAPIPEPASTALVGAIGGLLLARRSRV
jgi:hypothetical protein